MQSDQHKHGEVTDEGRKKRTFIFVLALAIAFMAYGLYLGNVFETYNNASTL